MSKSRDQSAALVQEFRHLSLNEAVEWIREGHPAPGEKVVLVDQRGQEHAVVMSRDEYASLMDYFELQSDPAQLAMIEQRLRELPSAESRVITPDTDFFEPSKR